MAGDNEGIPVQREGLKRKSAADRREWHRKLREGLDKRRCALPGKSYDDATAELVNDLRGYLDEFDELARELDDVAQALEMLGTTEAELVSRAKACSDNSVIFVERPSMELPFGGVLQIHKLAAHMRTAYNINCEAAARVLNGVRMDGVFLRALGK